MQTKRTRLGRESTEKSVSISLPSLRVFSRSHSRVNSSPFSENLELARFWTAESLELASHLILVRNISWITGSLLIPLQMILERKQ